MKAEYKTDWRALVGPLAIWLVALALLLLSCEISPDLVARKKAELDRGRQAAVEQAEQKPVRDLMTYILKLTPAQQRELRIMVLEDHALVEDHQGVRYLCRKEAKGWQVVAFGDGDSKPASGVPGLAFK